MIPRSVSSPELEIARQQWEAGSRRLESTRDEPRRYRRLHEQVDAMTAELRRRVGQTYSLSQLVEAYAGAEAWALDAVEAADSDPGWEREVALVTDAAFHLYARGASDYRP
jgi:chorismate-pyruvate lyase